MKRESIVGAVPAWAIAVVGILVTSAAQGQQQPTFEVNHFRPAERGSRWFAGDSLDSPPYQPLVVGTTFDWSHRPLSVFNAAGDRLGDLVENQFYLHLGASYTVMDRLRVGVNLPLVLATSGSVWDVRSQSYEAGSGGGLGDVRLGADYRVFGERGQALRAAVSVQMFLPTGKRSAYASDQTTRIYPRILAAGDLSLFTWAVSLGPDFRAQQDQFADINLGSDLGFTASAGARLLNGAITVGPELYGVSRMDSNIFTSKRTPLEAVLGAHYSVNDQWRIGAAAGPGITSGLGTPTSRVLLSVEFAPGTEAAPKPQPPADTDHDSISDNEDACPHQAGVQSAQPSMNGCPPPPPKDSDSDGILDEHDRCPNEVGQPTEDPKTNGCPAPKDADGDSVIDEQDACPNDPGAATQDPKTNGCPPPKDTDGDGITDDLDKCPSLAGPANTEATKLGCPLASIVSDSIVITDRVDFDNNRSTLRKDSVPVLSAVLEILKAHPEIMRVTVEGHTDNHGWPQANLLLSQQRAEAVVRWFVEHGIDAKRLAAAGRGQLQPIDDNASEQGRQRNRRVEFHITNKPTN